MTLGVLAAAAASSSVSDDVNAGVIAFLIVAAMGVALVFLLRSMNNHLRKVIREPRWREEAGGQGQEDGEHGGDGPRGGGHGPQGQPEPGYSRNGSGQPA